MLRRDEYIKRVRPFVGKDIVKVFTGIRRSGKSTLLRMMREELIDKGIPENRLLTINFESLTRSKSSMMDVYDEIVEFAQGKSGKIFIFLDEIQQLPEWEKMINSLRVDLDCDIYLTGSNSKLLSGELATHLAGRYIEILVYPFSFREVMSIENEKNPGSSPELVFQKFIRYGGMPFIYDNELDESATFSYLNDIYNSIILKDIVSRYSVRDVELFQRVMSYLLANIGNSFSGSNVMKYLKNEKRSLSLESIYNYITYAQDACLLHLVSREDIKGKRILKFQEKIFLADHGLREAIFGNNERDINQILENIVFIELIRRGYKVFIGKSGDREVDFIAEKGTDRIYVQVAYLLADEEVIKREFSVLNEIGDNFSKYVLSLDKYNFSRDGIIHKNLVEFLIEEEP